MFLPQLLLYPNPSDPLNGEAAALMMRDRTAYEQRVKGSNSYQALVTYLRTYPLFSLYRQLLAWFSCSCKILIYRLHSYIYENLQVHESERLGQVICGVIQAKKISLLRPCLYVHFLRTYMAFTPYYKVWNLKNPVVH